MRNNFWPDRIADANERGIYNEFLFREKKRLSDEKTQPTLSEDKIGPQEKEEHVEAGQISPKISKHENGNHQSLDDRHEIILLE